MDALHNLGIDFKVFLAQVINFGIVLFILTKFLYKPVLHALDSRKQKIADGLKNASEAEKKLHSAEQEYSEKMEAAKRETLKILEDARTAADAERQKMLADAEKEADSIKSSAREAMNAERRKMYQEMKDKIGVLAVLIVEKALKADLGESFYKKHLDTVLKQVKGM